MLHSEHCDRSLLSPSANKGIEPTFRDDSEVKKVVNVLKTLPDVRTSSSSITNITSPKAAAAIATISQCSMASSSTEAETHPTSQVNLSSKVRKRRVTFPSATTATSLSSLLATNDSQSHNHVNVIMKSPSKDNIISHLTNGVSAESRPHSNSTKTVTFSLGQQHNLNLVRLTPVSLRSTLERQSSSIAITELEVKNLKELVLLHLDLVQQQQTIIAEKDRLIAELRTESNMVIYSFSLSVPCMQQIAFRVNYCTLMFFMFISELFHNLVSRNRLN